MIADHVILYTIATVSAMKAAFIGPVLTETMLLEVSIPPHSKRFTFFLETIVGSYGDGKEKQTQRDREMVIPTIDCSAD